MLWRKRLLYCAGGPASLRLHFCTFERPRPSVTRDRGPWRSAWGVEVLMNSPEAYGLDSSGPKRLDSRSSTAWESSLGLLLPPSSFPDFLLLRAPVSLRTTPLVWNEMKGRFLPMTSDYLPPFAAATLVFSFFSIWG